MHVYYFITPTANSPGHNAGCSYITYGCKYLISQVDPEFLFLDVPITEHSQQEWDILLDQADALIFAGNPRYNPSDTRSYWDYDIWNHIEAAQKKGILVADLYGGSAYNLPFIPVADMVKDMLRYSRNQHTLSYQAKVDMIITRDSPAQEIVKTVKPDSVLLHCSSFWAASWLKVDRQPKKYNCVVLRYIQNQPWVIEALYSIAQAMAQEKQTFFLCHAGYEYWWAKKHLPEIKNLICIFDPLSLLQFYARCDKVVSMRLHGSIPALSLGCQVVNIATDSRCLAYDNFGFSSVPYTELKVLSGSLNFDKTPVKVSQSIQDFKALFNEKIFERLQ